MLAFELSDRRMTLAAFVVRNDGGFDADEVRRGLQDYVKQKLAPHKYPRSVVFMSELPKNGQALLRAARKMCCGPDVFGSVFKQPEEHQWVQHGRFHGVGADIPLQFDDSIDRYRA